MGAVLTLLLYLAVSLLAALAATALLRRPVSRIAALLLTLAPLAFTAGGLLPDRTLAPTVNLAGVPPWANPPLVELIEQRSSAPNPLLLDPLTQMQPWRRAARHDLLFNPAQGGGAALLANGQSAALFPLEIAARLLPPVRAATFVQMARLLLAAWGMFLLARRLALGEGPALIATLAFLGCGYLQLWRTHPHSYVAALAPWILAAMIELVRRPGPRGALATALAGAAAVYGGHPETLLHVLLFALAVVTPALVAGWRRHGWWRRRRAGGRMLAWGAIAALLAALLAAPLLLPFSENLLVSHEWELRQDAPDNPVELPLPVALTRLVPAFSLYALGDPIAGSWQAPVNVVELGAGAMGGAVLALLPVAFVRRRRRRQAVGWLLLGLVGLLVGAHLPLLSRPFGALPLLGTSLLNRLAFWWAPAAALLAGFAVEAALAAGTDRRRRIGLYRSALAGGALVSALALAAAACLLYFHDGRFFYDFTAWELAGEAALGIAAAAALALIAWAAARRRAAPPASSDPIVRRGLTAAPAVPLLLLVALLLTPRVLLFSRWVPLSTSFSFYPETESIGFVQGALAAGPPAGYRVAGLDAALVPHSAAFFGLEEARAYDPMTFAPYERFAGLIGEKGRFGWQRILEPDRPALSFLGVRYLFEHPYHGSKSGVEVAYRGFDSVVYENPRALPRLYLPAAFEALPTAETALERATTIDDFAALVTVSGAGHDAPAEGAGGALPASGHHPNPAGEVHDLAVASTGRIEARIVTGGPTLVATSQPAIPGWQLSVDGEAARPVRINGAFLGVWIERQGEHRIALRYAPSSWRWGLLLGGIGLVGVGLVGWRGWRALPAPSRISSRPC